MAETFRFSPRRNRAHEIGWHEWSRASFDIAAQSGKPVFLHLTVGWCTWCQQMDEQTFSDDAVIALLNERVVPIRVDADRHPHVQDRYIAGGWPTNAFLTPTGELLWSATYVDAAQLRQVATEVLTAWAGRGDELQTEIARRQRALEAARSRRSAVGLVRREAVEEIVLIAAESFDPRHGGFGDAPKFPPASAIELMYIRGARGDAEWEARADLTLDGMLAGELLDRVDGGFFRYALDADWTRPRREKLLEPNAALLRVYALGAHLRRRADWRDVAERTVGWVEATLRLPDGLWAGSQYADEAYFAAEAEARSRLEPPACDATVHVQWNAQWIAALADAGARLGRHDWIERAAAALDTLTRDFTAPGDLVYHYRVPGEAPANAHLLQDTLQTGIAALAVAQATGRPEPLAEARRRAAALERTFWADDGGFYDRARDGDDIGLLRYRDRAFEPNADAARFFLDLALVTGGGGYRACAERILATLSPAAARYGVAAAGFAIAADNFFQPPLRIFVVGDGAAADDLRVAALAVPRADRRVFAVPNGTRIGPLQLRTDEQAAAFVCNASSCSSPILSPAALEAAVPVPG
jgi:uncharacterized protein